MSDASPYPISQLIARIIRNSGYSSAGFIQPLGHPVAETGLADLESWLKTGEGDEEIIAQIAAAFSDEAVGLRRAVAETQAMIAAGVDPLTLERKKEKERFRPFIHADGERTVPNGVTLFGISGGHERWTTIEIPKAILKLPIDEQLAAVPELMRAYQRLYNGAVPFFDKLTGFKLVRLLDYFQFDKEGTFIEHVEKPFRRGQVTVWLA